MAILTQNFKQLTSTTLCLYIYVCVCMCETRVAPMCHRNKKCLEVATVEFLKGRLVLLLEIERPLSISHVFSKQSVFYFIKLSALFFSPLMLYFIFNPSLHSLPACLGRFL